MYQKKMKNNKYLGFKKIQLKNCEEESQPRSG